MKAIILAAGKGTRLEHYTEDMPKGMLDFNGKPVLQNIISTFRECGITDIIVVKGFAADKIDFDGLKYYVNEDYGSTNMVESLFCAEDEFDDGFIISYSDVLVERQVLRQLMDAEGDVVVTIDKAWKGYWEARYGRVDCDIESLSLSENGNIAQLGTPDVDVSTIDGRYVGLIKFSRNGAQILKRTYHQSKEEFWDKPWQQSGKPFQKAYMTDILQEIIDRGEQVSALNIHGGWLELDTVEDYEKVSQWLGDGSISRFFSIEK